MAHVFSQEIQDFLSRRIKEAEKGKESAGISADTSLQSYYDGKLLELRNVRQYLTENIDLKTHKYY